MINVSKIKRCVFQDENIEGGHWKVLWRMSHGSMSNGYSIIKDYCKHYGFTPSDQDIEIALGEMNNGFEVEWAQP